MSIKSDGYQHCQHYKIVRHYKRGGKRVIKSGLTLAQAQAYCSDPETSSSTAISAKSSAVTKRMGPWFDSYAD